MQLVKRVREAIERDTVLRAKHHIGEKFRFIRDRLTALLARLEKHAETVAEEEKNATQAPTEEEVIVYVYLYNAHGITVASWRNMISQKVFYEYSVNRPIYFEKQHVEELLRTKSSKNQHGYLAFIIKKTDILKPISETSTKDTAGNPLIKIREGSLKLEKLMVFVHNNQEYILDPDGQLIKKP